MGEYVWTTMQIGGKLSREKIAELESLGFGDEQGGDVEDQAELGEPVMFQGEVNYGNPEALRSFCEKHGLTYRVGWAAAVGAFSSGAAYWTPGMANSREIDTNDSDEPLLSLTFLLGELDAGKLLADILADYARATAPIPPIVIVEGQAS